MKVVFCIPTMESGIKTGCHQSLVAAYRLLNDAGIPYEEFVVENCPYLSTARAILTAMFMADKDATDMFCVDSDVKFDASAVLKMLQKPQGVISGIYPLKRDAIGWPVVIRLKDGIPIGEDGLIEAELVPVGFARIKRIVFESLAKAYPELKYEESVVKVMGAEITAAYDFYGMGVFGTKFKTEDYAFSQRWRDIGGHLWVYPDIDFEHIGSKAFTGNYHRFLLNQPGGARAGLDITRALAIVGWMTPAELEWLAEQASKHNQIVELGSCFGRSTRVLADNTKGLVFALDNWQGLAEWEPEKRATIEAEFRKNLADRIESGRVFAISMDHKDSSFFDSSLRADMVFVDGAHDLESVKRDIGIWKQRIQPGGLLCGHDAHYDDVSQAVRELLPGAEVASGTSIWHWQAP